MKEIVDLSIALEPNVSEPVPIEIEYISHREGANILGDGKIFQKDFPDGMAVNIEYIRLSTHSGTHIDAPQHYGPTCEGKKSKTIDEVPLSWFYNDGVVLECPGDITNGPVSQNEVEEALRKINYQIKPFDIVLIHTGADTLWGQPQYFTNFRGVSVQATKWLLEQQVKVIGVDSFSFDPPFHKMINDYCRTKDSKHLWPSHFYGRKKEYCQIERLINLDKISKKRNFKVACFPLKIKNCGAGWSRVVAILE